MHKLCFESARRKRNDSDEDIEKVLAELELEYSGQKKEVTEDIIEPTVEDEDKKKKEKKGGKKKDKGEIIETKEELKDVEPPKDNDFDDDMEVGNVKTAAQKKKEKKEREKQKKLAQKKAVSRLYSHVGIAFTVNDTISYASRNCGRKWLKRARLIKRRTKKQRLWRWNLRQESQK